MQVWFLGVELSSFDYDSVKDKLYYLLMSKAVINYVKAVSGKMEQLILIIKGRIMCHEGVKNITKVPSYLIIRVH